jgi:hypothetical protein
MAYSARTPIETDPESFGLLKELIDETYIDGID